jgi:hypothetical protein
VPTILFSSVNAGLPYISRSANIHQKSTYSCFTPNRLRY